MIQKYIRRAVHSTLSALVVAGIIMTGPVGGHAEEVAEVAKCGTDQECLITKLAVVIDPDAFLGCKNAGPFTKTSIASRFQRNITRQIYASLQNLKAKVGEGTTVLGVTGKFQFISVSVDKHLKKITAVVKLSVSKEDETLIEEQRSFEITVIVKAIDQNSASYKDQEACICLLRPEDSEDTTTGEVVLTVTKMCTNATTAAGELLAAGLAGTIFTKIGSGVEDSNQNYSEIAAGGNPNLGVLLQLDKLNNDKVARLDAETQQLEEENKFRQEEEELATMFDLAAEALGLGAAK